MFIEFLVLLHPTVSETFCTEVWFRVLKQAYGICSRMGFIRSRITFSGLELRNLKFDFSSDLCL